MKILEYNRGMQMGAVAKFRQSALNQCFGVLSAKDRKRVIGACVLQFLLSILDLIGVALVGILGSLAVSGVQSRLPGVRVSSTLNFFGINSLAFQQQVAILGLAAAGFFITRTILSIILSRKILFFISRRGSKISYELSSKLFSQGLTVLRKRSTQQNLYALTTGVQGITIGVIGTSILLVADFSLLIVLLIGLFAVDVVVASSTFALFAIVGLILYKTMHLKSSKLAKQNMTYAVQGAETIIELIDNFREYFVKNRRKTVISRFETNRNSLAESLAELSFMPTLSKYVIEASLLLSALLISALQFSLQDASKAVATLAVFMAAGSRIAPASLRLQQGLITVKSNLASSGLTLDLIRDSESWLPLPEIHNKFEKSYVDFNPIIQIKNVSFAYPQSHEEVIKNVSLTLGQGEFLAIVGKSGAGKSTLVDMLLGLITPQAGTVNISNRDPQTCLQLWPGAVAYVPQVTHVLNGSLRSNVCLGFSSGEFDDTEIIEALTAARLDRFLESLHEGLDTTLGEYGVGLSGGQLQRLGVARALLTKPRLIILDEATSSLDAQTEAEINEGIYDLKGAVTVVLIAHRLSSARNANKVAYLSNGAIEAIGSFEEVRNAVPDFDSQATLMGL